MPPSALPSQVGRIAEPVLNSAVAQPVKILQVRQHSSMLPTRGCALVVGDEAAITVRIVVALAADQDPNHLAGLIATAEPDGEHPAAELPPNASRSVPYRSASAPVSPAT